MVSVTSILRSGAWGPGPQRHWWPKGKDRTEGTRHVGVLAKGWGQGKGCGVGFKNICTAGKGLKGLLLALHASPTFQLSDLN